MIMEKVYFEDLSQEKPFQCYEQKYENESWRVAPHWHYYSEIVYIVSGCVHVFLNGSYHKLTQGEFVFIDSQAIHAFQVGKEWNAHMIILKFDKRLVLGPLESYDPLFAYLLSEERRIFPDGFIFSKGEVSNIADQLGRILQENEQRALGYELAIRTQVSSLFLWVIRQRAQDYRKAAQILRRVSDPSLERIQVIMTYVHNHYQESLSAEEAAEQCSMSYSYFSRKFKEVSGKTFSEYVNLIRVMEAEKLLTASSLSVTEIAMEVGFSNTSYFIKQFQKFRFCSPLQFRKKLLLANSTNSEVDQPSYIALKEWKGTHLS
jgi:AraC-like DNA-binding protein